MYVQVRTMDGKSNVTIVVSKLTSVEEFRSLVKEKLNIEKSRQRFFYRGKQLEDGYKLFDYDIRLNDVIQLMVKPDVSVLNESQNNVEVSSANLSDSNQPTISTDKEASSENGLLSKYFKIGDMVDVRNVSYGAWFEGKIVGFEQNGEKKDILQKEGMHVAENSGKSNNREHTNNISERESLSTLPVENYSDVSQTEIVDFKQNSEEKMEALQKESTHIAEISSKSNNADNISEGESSSKSPAESGSNVPQIENLLSDCKFEDEGVIYKVSLDEYEDDPALEVTLQHVRPRARHVLDFGDLKIGDVVMANYNIENPKSRGYWYDVYITGINKTRTSKELVGSIYVGNDTKLLENCKIRFCDEILKIEEIKPVNARNSEDDAVMQTETVVTRKSIPNCLRCNDNPRVKCRECSCHVCGGKDDPGSQILCDECNMAYHIRCLDPPLESVPDCDEWYCPECKNDENEIVKAGEKLKESKKKAKLPCQNPKSNRDWGKGMACVGRTKECTLVPPNHYGPIPGVEVGTSWLFRVQVSESGVHRPPVGGIHGRESDGAYSIVLSGGYEDDVDNGHEFFYTGSGGRDLSGNKRTAEQSCDQTLTRLNKALALNCNMPLNQKGAEAKNWKGGKPVRVVRNYKLSKHSKYAPEIGNRYDGIYKVVKYYPEKGKSGFVVWRYLLRRDDDTPAPWTAEGKKHIALHGLEKPLVPEGYLEANEEVKGIENSVEKTDKSRKRSSQDILKDSSVVSPKRKKQKTAVYKLEDNISKLIKEDVNTKLWSSCREFLKEGKQTFMAKVEETFMCICCQELVYNPVTTSCKHNMCKSCLKRSFAAGVYTCPFCRQELGENYKQEVNETLATILRKLFPGYEHGR